MDLPFEELPLDAQIRHVQDLWDRIAARAAGEEGDGLQEELERRWREHLAAPDTAVSWEELKASLQRT